MIRALLLTSLMACLLNRATSNSASRDRYLAACAVEGRARSREAREKFPERRTAKRRYRWEAREKFREGSCARRWERRPRRMYIADLLLRCARAW